MTIEIDVARPTREPLQGRSRASFERMLVAAEKLLVERGNDEFTLTDVSRKGKVSIGSIYCRFDSKDALIHAVQTRCLARADAEMASVIAHASGEARDLDALVCGLVGGIADALRAHAGVLRPFMLRSTTDPVIASRGKHSYGITEQLFQNAVLARRPLIAHPDPERAVLSCFRIIYAALARYLGFGSPTTAALEADWEQLKEDLSAMCSAFLRAPAARAERRAA